MKIEHKAFPLEVREVADTGEFSGYLSVFGNVDSYREIVMPGAFVESLGKWQAKGRLPPVLWQHRSGEPIGPFTTMREDGKGLYVEGRLLVADVQRAREAHALMKAKAIGGMSIGFETIGEEFDKNNRIRKLTKVELWEGSIVTFPANEAAQVEAVKSLVWAGELPDLPTFERHLCEAGFSRTQAKAVASRGLSYLLQCEAAGNSDGDEVKQVIEALRGLRLS